MAQRVGVGCKRWVGGGGGEATREGESATIPGGGLSPCEHPVGHGESAIDETLHVHAAEARVQLGAPIIVEDEAAAGGATVGAGGAEAELGGRRVDKIGFGRGRGARLWGPAPLPLNGAPCLCSPAKPARGCLTSAPAATPPKSKPPPAPHRLEVSESLGVEKEAEGKPAQVEQADSRPKVVVQHGEVVQAVLPGHFRAARHEQEREEEAVGHGVVGVGGPPALLRQGTVFHLARDGVQEHPQPHEAHKQRAGGGGRRDGRQDFGGEAGRVGARRPDEGAKRRARLRRQPGRDVAEGRRA
eukprot:scaffold22167_cov101-Isochrysis_galbana.AAC.1